MEDPAVFAWSVEKPNKLIPIASVGPSSHRKKAKRRCVENFGLGRIIFPSENARRTRKISGVGRAIFPLKGKVEDLAVSAWHQPRSKISRRPPSGFVCCYLHGSEKWPQKHHTTHIHAQFFCVPLQQIEYSSRTDADVPHTHSRPSSHVNLKLLVSVARICTFDEDQSACRE